jgi:hypothetical protein
VLKGWTLIPGKERIFLFTAVPRLVLGPTQSPVKLYTKISFPVILLPKHEDGNIVLKYRRAQNSAVRGGQLFWLLGHITSLGKLYKPHIVLM